MLRRYVTVVTIVLFPGGRDVPMANEVVTNSLEPILVHQIDINKIICNEISEYLPSIRACALRR